MGGLANYGFPRYHRECGAALIRPSPGIVHHGEAHLPLKPVRPGDNEPHTAPERVGGNPAKVLAARRHRSLNALTPVAGHSFEVESYPYPDAHPRTIAWAHRRVERF